MVKKRTKQEIANKIKQISTGDFGITCGLPDVDFWAGKLEPGNIWIVGGYTGTGKSYVVLNMIEGMLGKVKENILVFSTEMTAADYYFRLACMRVGVWELSVKQQPKNYLPQVVEALSYMERTKNLEVIGGKVEFAEMERIIREKKPRVVFVDHVHDMSFEGNFETSEIMGRLAGGFKQISLDLQNNIICVSQVNNYVMMKNYSSDKTRLHPFAHGKMFSNKARVAIVFERFVDDKTQKLTAELDAKIIKARGGRQNRIKYHIKEGFRLEKFTYEELKQCTK